MIEAMESGKYRFVMCNFAPPDMVGHTGVYDAAVKAVDATGKPVHEGSMRWLPIEPSAVCGILMLQMTMHISTCTWVFSAR